MNDNTAELALLNSTTQLFNKLSGRNTHRTKHSHTHPEKTHTHTEKTHTQETHTHRTTHTEPLQKSLASCCPFPPNKYIQSSTTHCIPKNLNIIMWKTQ